MLLKLSHKVKGLISGPTQASVFYEVLLTFQKTSKTRLGLDLHEIWEVLTLFVIHICLFIFVYLYFALYIMVSGLPKWVSELLDKGEQLEVCLELLKNMRATEREDRAAEREMRKIEMNNHQ
jgi:hypothetical protein